MENQLYHNGKVINKIFLEDSNIWNKLDSGIIAAAADNLPWHNRKTKDEIRDRLIKITQAQEFPK